MNIKEQIIRLRLSKNISQREMAKKVGVSPVHYNRIERGRTGCSISILEKIASQTGTKLVITFIEE